MGHGFGAMDAEPFCYRQTETPALPDDGALTQPAAAPQKVGLQNEIFSFRPHKQFSREGAFFACIPYDNEFVKKRLQ